MKKGGNKMEDTLLNFRGMACPIPIVKTTAALKKAEPGETINVVSDDAGFERDIIAWCEQTGNILNSVRKEGADIIASVTKKTNGNGSSAPVVQEQVLNVSDKKIKALEDRIAKLETKDNNLSLVLFSGDMDKAMAAFIIATGAAAVDKEVTMFATFWGLDAIKKSSFSTSGRGLLEKMVLWMRPKGPRKLSTSKMNFAGIGPKLFNFMMGKKNIETLPSLVEMATEMGVKIVACQMSMDVMGIKKEDLIDGVEVGGVAAFLSDSYKSNTTLFI
jgi:peroxiredoxin family protein/TusA-related sulfurtransferase